MIWKPSRRKLIVGGAALVASPSIIRAQVGQIPAWPPTQFISSGGGFSGAYEGIGSIAASNWYGLRAFSAAKAAAKANLFKIVDSAGANSLIVTCNTSGDIDSTVIAGWAGTGSMFVNYVYDQAGTLDINSTNGNSFNPQLVLSPSGITAGKYALKFSGAQHLFRSGGGITVSNPWGTNICFTATVNNTAPWCDDNNSAIFWNTTPALAGNSTGSVLPVSAGVTQGTFYSGSQLNPDTTHDSIYVNGTLTSVTGTGFPSNWTSSFPAIGVGSFASGLTGYVLEWGIWPSTAAGGQTWTGLSSNQRSYWGF